MISPALRLFSVLLCLSLALAACSDDKGSDPTDTLEEDTAADTATDTAADTATDTTADTAADTVADTTDTTDTTVDTTDTTVDTTDTTVDPFVGTCLGILTCVETQCAGQFGAARETCVTSCRDAGDEGTKGAYNAYDSCMTLAGCYPANDPATDQDIKDQADCQRGNCLTETISCFTADTFGAGTCSDLNGCVAANCIDRQDFRCVGNCMTQATMVFATDWLDYTLCIRDSCYDSTQSQIDFEACEQQARNNPECSLEDSECFGDVGAAPGAGAGGGLPGQ